MISFSTNKILLLSSILLVLLFSNFSNYQNLEEFSFDKLKREKIIFKDISLKEDEIYGDRISLVKEANSSKTPILHSIKLSNEYELFHGCYDSIPANGQESNNEYLEYYDTRININLLLENNSNKEKISNQNYILFTKSIDFFEFNKEQFILLSARDRRFFRNLEINYWILLKVKNKSLIKAFCFIDGYQGGNDCFADFNNDGVLDYMNWNFLKNKISIYSLRKDNFEINKKHFIKLKQSKEQNDMTKDLGFVLVYDLFDKKNSKWFYKL